jgi:hypothetical protein
MMIVTETLAQIAFDGKVRSLGTSDGARSSFTAHVGNSLIALSLDLNVLGRWPVDVAAGRLMLAIANAALAAGQVNDRRRLR